MKAGSRYVTILLVLLNIFAGNSIVFASEALTLDIDTAVSMALKGNLDLQLQKNEVEIGHGAELMEKGAFDSHLEATISDAEQEITPLFTGGSEREEMALWSTAVKKKMATGTEVALSWENGRNDTDSQHVVMNPSYNSTFGLSISQPLMKGNSKRIQTARARAARKYTEASVHMVEDQTANLAADVKKSYWELVYARQDIEVKKLSLELARNLREETSRKIESGLLAKVEIWNVSCIMVV